MSDQSSKLVEFVVEVGKDKIAEDICAYQIEDGVWLANHVIMLGAKNTIHCKSILEALGKGLKQNKDLLEDVTVRVSGDPDSEWVILDLYDVHVHIVSEEKRVYYKLDALFEQKGVVFHY